MRLTGYNVVSDAMLSFLVALGSDHLLYVFIISENIHIIRDKYHKVVNIQELYHYEVIGAKLIIGKFCSIAPEVRFLMDGGNHRMDGSTFPYNIFGHGWEKRTPSLNQLSIKGDTVVGNDVWIGRRATIMPGVRIGDGSIISAEAVVVKDVEPYTIVGGNSAREIKQRYSSKPFKNFWRLNGGTSKSISLTSILARL